MRKYLVVILILLGVVSVLYRDKIFNNFKNAQLAMRSLEFLNSVPSNESLPEPLRVLTEDDSGKLTSEGVFELTNKERLNNGQKVLKLNAQLSKAAEAKIEDMLGKQYFDHYSPEGLGPSSFAEGAGYKYLLIGENLATGGFKDDADLVAGWMNSPGHRANILNEHYLEIGVAVREGMFEGKKTWMAVQEFGTPLSVCPGVDLTLKNQIDDNKAQIDILEDEASSKKSLLENSTYESTKDYNNAVKSYNETVRRINSLVDQTKILINNYNTQVNLFNSCIKDNS